MIILSVYYAYTICIPFTISTLNTTSKIFTILFVKYLPAIGIFKHYMIIFTTAWVKGGSSLGPRAPARTISHLHWCWSFARPQCFPACPGEATLGIPWPTSQKTCWDRGEKVWRKFCENHGKISKKPHVFIWSHRKVEGNQPREGGLNHENLRNSAFIKHVVAVKIDKRAGRSNLSVDLSLRQSNVAIGPRSIEDFPTRWEQDFQPHSISKGIQRGGCDYPQCQWSFTILPSVEQRFRGGIPHFPTHPNIALLITYVICPIFYPVTSLCIIVMKALQHRLFFHYITNTFIIVP